MRIPLQPDIIRAALDAPGARWSRVEFHPALESTNERAKVLLRSYAEHQTAAPPPHPLRPSAGEPGVDDGPLWGIVVADHQTGGRGRLGRSWEVPDRAAIALSATVPVAEPAAAGWMPLLAGLALSRAITEVAATAGTTLTTRLKWPNDVLLANDEDRKVSGILCELVPLAPGAGLAVVVGTGINIDQTRAELPVDTATSLALAGATIRREDLIVAYLGHLGELTDPTGDGSGAIDVAGGRAAYGLACSTIGAQVRVNLPTGEVVEGEATGVDRAGGLVVATVRGVRSFPAGDVVHVRNARGGLA
ncbi:MAG: biotin--[acetyl-CoA-carboxylase] ligase [Micrococcales bacterium]|nr:biotin--[acetyl-CoA-carboxylase] ligase [Micrococcales bacterium]